MSGLLLTRDGAMRARIPIVLRNAMCMVLAASLIGCEASAPPSPPAARKDAAVAPTPDEASTRHEFAPRSPSGRETSDPAEPPHRSLPAEAPHATVQQMPLPAEAPHATVQQMPLQPDPPAVRSRLPDDRPDINEVRLQQAGITVYRSQRLVLLTDLAASEVADLPALADQLFAALEAHFGALPEASDGSSFQVTGHVIGDENKFRQAGLMPQAAFTFQHGRHLNYQFWMYNAPTDYYRRHLLFHEFTHCFMTCESGMLDIPPLWYIEGMAEYFATHQLTDAQNNSSQQARFGILPDQFAGYEGWGRISEIRRAFDQQASVQTTASALLSIAPLSEVTPNTVSSFDQDLQYAYSWAMCWLLNQHPQYQDTFLPLANLRRRQPFVDRVATLKQAATRLPVDWLLFIEDLCEGYDQQRSFPVHSQEPVAWNPAAEIKPESLAITADRGWQDTGIRLTAGQRVTITAEGRFQVSDSPRPWISEPQGVSIEYVRGLPLGQLVAILVEAEGQQISNRLSIGRNAELTAPFDCSVWLQINDFSNSRHDNQGQVQVTISAAVVDAAP